MKIGVIGTGHLGRFHTKVYSQLEEAELVGVYDIDQNKAKKVADEFGTKSFSQLGQLLVEIEAASLVVPTSSHLEVGKEVLEHKIHLLIEKPIAQTVDKSIQRKKFNFTGRAYRKVQSCFSFDREFKSKS